MSNYTQGPWKAVGHKIYSTDGLQVGSVYPVVNPDDVNRDEVMMNSRLMAAGPEMLRLIQRLTSPYMAEMDYRSSAFIDASVLIDEIMNGYQSDDKR